MTTHRTVNITVDDIELGMIKDYRRGIELEQVKRLAREEYSTITLAMLIDALPKEDRENLKRLVEALEATENIEGYDESLRAYDEQLRRETGLGVREHDVLRYFVGISDETRDRLIHALQDTRKTRLQKQTDESNAEEVAARIEKFRAKEEARRKEVENRAFRIACGVVGTLIANDYLNPYKDDWQQTIDDCTYLVSEVLEPLIG